MCFLYKTYYVVYIRLRGKNNILCQLRYLTKYNRGNETVFNLFLITVMAYIKINDLIK